MYVCLFVCIYVCREISAELDKLTAVLEKLHAKMAGKYDDVSNGYTRYYCWLGVVVFQFYGIKRHLQRCLG